jgi:hypothetical protein
MAAHLRTGSPLYAGKITGFGPRTAVSVFMNIVLS